MQVNPFQGEREAGCFYFSPALSQVYNHGSVAMLLKNCFCGPVFYSPMGLMHVSPTDYQSWGDWGAPRSGCMLKGWSAGCVVCGPDGSLLKDKLGAGESLQLYVAAPGVGFTAAVSQPCSPMGIFSVVWCIGVTPLVSEFLSEDFCSMCSICSVSLWEKRSPLQIWFLKRILVTETHICWRNVN